MRLEGCFRIPLHVSGIWRPQIGRAPISTGSLGAGLLLTPGALCCPSNVLYPRLPHYRFFKKTVNCRLPVKVGVGYATSAIFSLASSLLESRGFTETVAKAHIVEILMRTGLGDVMAIAYGKGLALRTKSGGPGWGRVENLNVPSRVSILSATIESAWKDTPSMLSSIKNYDFFNKLWRNIMERRSLEAFLESSYTFSTKLNMYPKDLTHINRMEGVVGSYAKKSVLVIVIENDRLHDMYCYLKNTYYKRLIDLKIFEIDRSGLRYTNNSD